MIEITSSTSLLSICENLYFRRNQRIRCEATRKQYRIAIADFSASLGHTATVADLDDDSVSAMMNWAQEKGLAAKTTNERRGRIHTLWSWLAKRGLIKTFPTTPCIPEPERVPVAWSRDELGQLWEACGKVCGSIAGIPAALWWRSLHLVAWDTGERINALLSCEWSHLSTDWLVIPAELRKGKKRDMAYRLAPDTMDLLSQIRIPDRKKIWPWPYHWTYLWTKYRQIRKRAGLSVDRRSAFHRIRRSVATHFEAAGGNSTELLGHTSRALTVRAYLDPRFAKQQSAIDLLFRPHPPNLTQ